MNSECFSIENIKSVFSSLSINELIINQWFYSVIFSYSFNIPHNKH